MPTLTRRQFLKTASAAIPLTVASTQLNAGEPNKKQPNIVFIFADQMRAHAMGCMGNDQVITPNLDKLASEGLLISNAISAQPVCTPYRAQLLTGRYGHSTGVIHNDIRLPDSEILISQQLKKSGYATGYIGKWHLSGSRRDPVDAVSRRGWDFWAVRNCSHKHAKASYWLNDGTEPIEVPGWEPDIQTDLTIEYIEKKKSEPFALFLSFGPPHNPYKAPQKYKNMYDGVKLKARANVPNGSTKNLLEYYSMVTSLDICVGRISSALEKSGIADNTLVVFTSDHGDMLGSQGHSLKQRPWEESINVPFIVRYPEKISKNQKKDWIVSSVDVMPTLLALCGAEIPKKVDGMNYAQTFLGKDNKERDAAFLFNVHKGAGPKTDWRGIRTKAWTYAHHFKGDWVMYDLKKDPFQLNNLVHNPKHKTQKEKLSKQLATMRKALDESIPLKGRIPNKVKIPV